jgi:hypothetical protein
MNPKITASPEPSAASSPPALISIGVTVIADAPAPPAWDALWRRLLAPVPGAPTPTPLPPRPPRRRPRPAPRPEREEAA